MRFTVADCVATNAIAFGDRVALELLDPRATGSIEPVETWTYSDVWRRMVALADAASPVAAGPNGPMLAMLLPNNVDHALAYLAAQLIGAAAVPVNSRLAAPEVEYVLRDSGASVMLTGGEFVPFANEIGGRLGVRVIDVADIRTPATTPAWSGPSGEEAVAGPAMVAYTSGTTGFPKGSVGSIGALLIRFHQWGWTFGMGPEIVHSVPGPLFHGSYGGLTIACLAIGARSRIMASFDPALTLEEYRHHSTWVFLVPSMLAMVLEAWREQGGPPAEALRFMLSSGAPGPMSLLHSAFELFPNAKIAEAYGWTEGGWVTFEVKDRATLTPHSVGWPMIATEVVVVDPETGRRCAVGEAGEVCARSLQAFGGYLNKPGATAAAMTADGYTRSGDVGIWLPDGRLTIVDRVKDMIISGGENV